MGSKVLGGDPVPGPPYTHVHRLPETEEDAAAEPFLPAFTVERRPSWGLFGTPVAPVPFFPVKDKPQQEVPEAFRRKP
jgi:hypothetical protein